MTVTGPSPSLDVGGAGRRVIVLGEIDSTQGEAARLAARGERGPVWIRAVSQTAGRGRDGRMWRTVEGNLAATLLFSPACAPSALPGLALVAGVAAMDAVSACVGPVDCRLKWPNDLLADGAKLAGILIESLLYGRQAVVLAGIGINVRAAPTIAGRKTVALNDLNGVCLTPEQVFEQLASQLDRWLAIWDNGAGFQSVRSGWLERAGPIGEPLTLHTGHGQIGGRYAGLARDGGLLLDCDDGTRQSFAFGDVALGR